MKISFVIPIWNNWKLINQLLVDIQSNCTPDEIVVVDDCSTDQETLDGVSWWAHNYSVKLIRPVQNLHFLKASNYGVSKATGDAICLISSDVRIETDLAKIIRDLLTVDPNRFIGGVVYMDTTGWNEFDKKVFPYAEGWLLCCMKSAWDSLGGFDERFAPHDFEDVDISTSAIHNGLTLYAINSDKIRHMGAQTIGYTDERRELTERNREKFREKWIK